MKKLISCLLAVALVFSLMSVSVFAGTEVHPNDGNVTADTAYSVVGNHKAPGGEKGTIEDGVSNFDEVGNNATITVNFNDDVDGDDDNQGGGGAGNSTIENRYAIDITYKTLVIDLTEIPNEQEVIVDDETYTVTTTYTWDVNNYVYVPVVTTVPPVNQEDEAAVEAATQALKDPITIADAYFITNHSDLPVYYKSALANTYTDALTMTLKDTATSTDTGDGFYMVDRAIAGTYTDENNIDQGSARLGNTHYIEATPIVDTDWLATINKLAGVVSNGQAIGSITISVAATTGGAEFTNYTATPNP